MITSFKYRRSAWKCLAIIVMILSLPTSKLDADEADSETDSSWIARRDAAMQRGMLAVQAESWKLAARYFEEARKADPGSAAVLKNLALANDRIGGRELLSIAWYRAFLSTNPDARTEEAVRQRIKALDVMAEGKLISLLQTIEETTGMITDNKEKSERFRGISYVQAKLGDFHSALLTAARCFDSKQQSYAFRNISDEQRRKGDLMGAADTAEKITDDGDRSSSLRYIARDYAKSGNRERARYLLNLAADAAKSSDDPEFSLDSIAEYFLDIGDIDGARRTADAMSDYSWLKSCVFVKIAESHVGSGDKDDARRAIDEAIRIARNIPSVPKGETVRAFCYSRIADYYFKNKDWAAGREIAARIPADGELLYCTSCPTDTFVNLVFYQASAGDIEGAKYSASRLVDKQAISLAKVDIALVQAREGDVAAAEQTIATAKNESSRCESSLCRGYRRIAEAYIKAGNHEKAKEAIAKALSFADSKDDDYLPIAELQFQNGDLEGGRETVKSHLRGPYYTYLLDDDYRRILDLQIQIGDQIGAEQLIAKYVKCPEEFVGQVFQSLGVVDGQLLDKAACEKVENICRWTGQALEWQERQEMVNFGGFLRDQQGKSPEETTKVLIDAAEKMKDALLTTRK